MNDCLDYAVAVGEKIKDVADVIHRHRENLADAEIENKEEMLADVDNIQEDMRKVLEIHNALGNKIEQCSIRRSIEITGLPEKYAKSIDGVSNILSALLHIQVPENCISDFNRIEEPTDDEKGIVYPRPLKVTLTSKNMKNRILRVVEHVVPHLPGYDMPITVIEHLTLMNKKLLKRAREQAEAHNIEKVWVKNGNIFFRKTEISNIYEIRCPSDIEYMATAAAEG